MKKITFLILVCFLLFSCEKTNQSDEILPQETVSKELNVQNDEKIVRGPIVIESLADIEEAVQMLTLEEKVGQMIQAERNGIQLSEIKAYNIGSILSGGGSAPSKNTPEGWVELYNRMQKVSRRSTSGIPIVYGIDAVHGHNNVENVVIYPHNIGLGATDNPELMYQIGQAVADDLNATGLNWNFAPAVSIVQDLRWGRSYESFSESTDLVSRLSVAYIKGLESKGIISTTKHFIGDGYTDFGSGESNQILDRGDVVVPIDTLLERYLPAYQAAIEAGTKSIMVSYNSVNGLKMHEHTYLLNDVLRGELGFEGLVISDWEAIHALPGDLNQQVEKSVNAGIDMLMQPYNWKDIYHALLYNVKENKISEERIDEAVARILKLKFEAGLFIDDFEKVAGDIDQETSKDLARTAVSESLVLLKNDNLLPLDVNKKYFLDGPAIDNVGIQSGGWTLSWQGESLPDLNNGISIRDAFISQVGQSHIVSTAEEADIVVLAIGESPYAEMMGDTRDLSLTGVNALSGNVEVIEAAMSSNKPVLTIMISGRPLLLEDYLKEWDAFVMAWLPGTQGDGITDVLFGEKAFVGQLPVTWPKNNDQASDTVMMKNYLEIEHQFKFGDGL